MALSDIDRAALSLENEGRPDAFEEDVSPQGAAILDWFKGLGSDQNFEITPERLEEDGRVVKFPPIYGRKPNLNEIGTKFGGGKWQFSVTYHPANWTGPGRENKTKTEVSKVVELDKEVYAPLHRAYVEKQDRERLEEKRRQMREDNLGGGNHLGLFMEGMKTAMEMLRSVPAQAPQAPANNDSMFMLEMIRGMQEDRRRAEENAQAMRLEMTKMQNENTRILVESIKGNKSEGGDVFGRLADRFLGMMESTMRIRSGMNDFLAPQGTPIAESEDMDVEKDEFDWKALISGLATKLLPNLGFLQMMPEGAAQKMVQENIKGAVPNAEEVLKQFRENDRNRLEGIKRAVLQWGAETGRQVLHVLNIPYTETELTEAVNWAASQPKPKTEDEEEGGQNA